jgi:hypothetical protein
MSELANFSAKRLHDQTEIRGVSQRGRAYGDSHGSRNKTKGRANVAKLETRSSGHQRAATGIQVDVPNWHDIVKPLYSCWKRVEDSYGNDMGNLS